MDYTDSKVKRTLRGIKNALPRPKNVLGSTIALVTIILYLALLILAFAPWTFGTGLVFEVMDYNSKWLKPCLILTAIVTMTFGRWCSDVVFDM